MCVPERLLFILTYIKIIVDTFQIESSIGLPMLKKIMIYSKSREIDIYVINFSIYDNFPSIFG